METRMEDWTAMADFEKLDASEDVEIPVLPGNRTVTDKKGFVIYGIGILLLLPFLIYTLTKSDLRHLTDPYDDCGNFCGFKNTYIERVPCSGKDFSEQPYNDWINYRCTNSCGPHREIFEKKCYRTDATSGQFAKMDSAEKREVRLYRQEWWKFLFTAIITIGLSLLILLVLKYIPFILLWVMIIVFILNLLALTGFLWFYNWVVLFVSETLFSLTASLTIIVIIMIIVLLLSLKKIQLFIQLYKEAFKVLTAMPLLIIVSVLTTFVHLIILGICYTICYYMTFAYDLYLVDSEKQKYEYDYSPLTLFTIAFNIFITIWTMAFIAGIQYTIISGSVTKWYFRKKKNCLDSPIFTSALVTTKYHLGTVAFGSLLITLFAVIKALIKLILSIACCRCLKIWYFTNVEMLLKFISEYPYVETALRGQSYYKSAKRTTNVLRTNAEIAIDVNCVGDFILVVTVIVVTSIANGISFGLLKLLDFAATWILALICSVTNIIVVYTMFATVQIMIDTLLICFCEDLLLHEGVSQTYFTLRGLTEFIENTKKMYGKNEKVIKTINSSPEVQENGHDFEHD